MPGKDALYEPSNISKLDNKYLSMFSVIVLFNHLIITNVNPITVAMLLITLLISIILLKLPEHLDLSQTGKRPSNWTKTVVKIYWLIICTII